MRYLFVTTLAGGISIVFLTIGCATDNQFKQKSASSTAAIKTAEEAGATDSPHASYYLRLAKEESEQAQDLASHGKKEQAASMLLRAEADAKLAIAFAREASDKAEAAAAMGRVQQLRIDNQLPAGSDQ